MTGDNEYDWADDEDLDLDATLQQLAQLQPAVVTTHPYLVFEGSPLTTAGVAEIITKSFYGPRQLASNIT